MSDLADLFRPTLETAVQSAEARPEGPAQPGRGAGSVADMFLQRKLLQDVARAGYAERIQSPDLGWQFMARPQGR